MKHRRRLPEYLHLLEAMACGTAVVGVAEGGVPETVVDGVTGLLRDRNPDEFAAAVQTVLRDAELRERFGREGRSRVLASWSWDRAAKQIEGSLKRLSEEYSKQGRKNAAFKRQPIPA